jgi:hypothetical protein
MALKWAVVARVPTAPFRPLCDMAVNRAAVRSSWGASDGYDNQQPKHEHDRDDDSENLVIS